MDVTIEKNDKALIFLNSLPNEEYEAFVLTLINGKLSLNYNDVSAALVNHEVRRKDMFSFRNRGDDCKRDGFQSSKMQRRF